MKRELIALAVAGVSVFGCESSGLSPREVPGRSQPGLLYGMYENLAPGDGSAAAAAPAKPLRLPVSVAVVQVGEVAPPQPMIDALRKDPAVFARVEALPYVDPAVAQQQSYGYYNTWEQGPPAPAASATPRPSLAGIRRLAADTGMDYVLLVGGTVDHGSSGTPLSLLDITIIGGFIIPSRETRGTAVASAALIDVPTGRVIVNSSAEARRTSFVPAASVSGERAKLLQAIRDDVVKKLGAQVLADVRQRGVGCAGGRGRTARGPRNASTARAAGRDCRSTRAGRELGDGARGYALRDAVEQFANRSPTVPRLRCATRRGVAQRSREIALSGPRGRGAWFPFDADRA